MGIFRHYIGTIQQEAERDYRRLFNRHLHELENGRTGLTMLDIGCFDGSNTLRLTEGMKNTTVYGLEVVPERVEEARQRGILARVGKADTVFPFEDGEFDVITSNQVIEHLNNQDLSLSETYRVLKPGGAFLLCTANLSSWHNVGALALGWQPFPMTNFTERDAAIGNPFAFHCGEAVQHISMLHTRLYTLRALQDLLRLYDFQIELATGTGYYPLPTRLAQTLAKFDPNHCAFQYIRASKKK